jgi:hypothetical protein
MAIQGPCRFRGCWIQLKRKPDSRRQGQAKFDRGIGSFIAYIMLAGDNRE